MVDANATRKRSRTDPSPIEATKSWTIRTLRSTGGL
jgi:hypothetical protein